MVTHSLTGHTAHIIQACPFTLEVFTEDCEGEIEIVDLLPFNPVVDPALCHLVMERGVCGEVRDGGGHLLMYTFTTPHLTTIAMENKVHVDMFNNTVTCFVGRWRHIYICA